MNSSKKSGNSLSSSMRDYKKVGHISQINPHLFPIRNMTAWHTFLQEYRYQNNYFRWSGKAKQFFRESCDCRFIQSDYRDLDHNATNPLFRTGNVITSSRRCELWVVFSGILHGISHEGNIMIMRGFLLNNVSIETITALEVNAELTK